MINLNRLKGAQTQLLLAEVVGLLHNLGKLSSNFITKNASDAPDHFEYEFERVVKPGDVLQVAKATHRIENELWLELIRSLCDEPIWGPDASVARALCSNLSGAPSGLRGTRRRLMQACETAKDAEAAPAARLREIRNKLASAAALADLWQGQGKAPSAYDLLDQVDEDDAQRQFLLNTSLNVLNVSASLGELILLMWDKYHGWPEDQQRDEVLAFWTDRSSVLQRYLMTAHGVVSGIEKEGEDAGRQSKASTYVASAFGFEADGQRLDLPELDVNRDMWLKAVMVETQRFVAATSDSERDAARNGLLRTSEAVLRAALGETQRPINDLTLWDYVSSIAALFKAAVAKAILEGHFAETSELRWQLLSVRYDGLAFLGQADHISDLLARKDSLETGQEAVRVLIEVEWPLASEIYRDENGSIYIIPHVVDEEGLDVNLLSLPVEGDGTLSDLIAHRFGSAGEHSPLAGEVWPVIVLNKALPEQAHAGLLGKDIRLPHAGAWANPPLRPDPASVEQWWSEEAKQGEVCTICGLRPQGYGAPERDWQRHLDEAHRPGQFPVRCQVCKAQDRALCHVCMERRGDRSKAWATDESEIARTIWTDEVADDDGRMALIVGRFDLNGWLDGQLIATTQRNDSFGRIRRCWGTTQEFWRQIEEDLSDLVGGCCRSRLIITPQNGDQLRNSLGSYHAYEMELDGRYLSVVWDPRGEGRLISSENLDYALKTLRIGGLDDLQEHLRSEERLFSLYEPSAHLARRERKGLVRVREVERQSEAYSPAITLLAEPAVFMALVPGDKAMAVAQQVREKYDTEMGKVRDRLPLHIGLVYAPRRTPVRAILEAGRRMLNMRSDWQPWQVVSAGECNSDSPHAADCWVITFDNGVVWHMPLRMGDHSTDDHWYSHVLLRPPVDDKEELGETTPWRRACELAASHTVHVRPSLFDFEFLDAPARRFEIAYDGAGRRRGSATRPFLLEELDRLEGLWQALVPGEGRGLSSTQLRNLERILRDRITEWHGGDVAKARGDETYRVFAVDTLHRLDKSWWAALDEQQQANLEQAAQDGDLMDLLYLMMHILKEEPKPEQSAANGERG